MITTRSSSTNDPSTQNNQVIPFPLFKLVVDVIPDVIPDDICINFSVKTLGLFAQTSKAAEQETAFLRLMHSAIAAEPESYKWYDLVLMSSLNDDEKNAEKNKIYIAEDGSYLVCDTEGKISKGAINDKNIKLSDVENKLNDPNLKNQILEFTANIGHAPYDVAKYKESETNLAVIAILKRCPAESLFELLFSKEVKITDHYGREIKASLYRLLLGTGDLWAIKQIHEEILLDNEDMKAEARRQFEKQFPGCKSFDPKLGEEQLYDERNKKQIEDVIAQLKLIVKKVTADPCTNALATNNETKEAVAALCRIFMPKEGEIIETGLHFPLGMLKEIGKVYDLARWDIYRVSYFSFAVIGAVLAASTAVYGQCYKNGLSKLDMKKGPDRRDGLFCRHPKGIPLAKAPFAGELGKTLFVDPDDGLALFRTDRAGYVICFYKNGEVLGLGPMRGGRAGYCTAVYSKLWKTKAETYGSYYATTRREVNTLSGRA